MYCRWLKELLCFVGPWNHEFVWSTNFHRLYVHFYEAYLAIHIIIRVLFRILWML